MTDWKLAWSALAGAAILLLTVSAEAAEPGERCAVMVQSGDRVETRFIDGFIVSGSSSPLQLPEGGANAILCERHELVIGDDDHRVILDLGLPIYVVSQGRVVVLEMSSGQFRARVLQGELNEAERESLSAALNRAQAMGQGRAQ